MIAIWWNRGGGVGLEERKERQRIRVEGVPAVIIVPLILDTSGICGLAVFVPKIHSLDSNPLLCYYSVQKVYNLDPN